MRFKIPENMKTVFECEGKSYEGIFSSGGTTSEANKNLAIQRFTLAVSIGLSRTLIAGKKVTINNKDYIIGMSVLCDNFCELRLGKVGKDG